MYLKLNVPKLLELTFPDILPIKEERPLKAEILDNFDITNKRGIPVQKKRDTSPIKEGGVSKISETNTNNTTETTTDILQQDLNLVELHSSPVSLSTEELERKIKENISYDILMTDRRVDKNNLRNILSIMVDVIRQKSGLINVNSKPIEIEEVKKRFLEINQYHVEEVLDTFSDYDKEIKNIRAYMITALYNEPSSMDLKITNKINSDNFYS